MNKRALRADILLLITAGIWGFGFTAQRSGMFYTGPFAYNGIRFIIGSLSLFPVILIQKKFFSAKTKPKKHQLFIFSLSCGSCMFVAVILQQFGLLFTTAGKAGFITGLYVILTPLIGIFLGRKTGKGTWFGSLFTLAGLFFVCNIGDLDSVNPGDIIVVISAVFWACHVLLIDKFVKTVNPIALSSGQFAVCGLLSLTGAFLAEPYIKNLVKWFNPALLNTGEFNWLPLSDILAGIADSTFIISADVIIPILYGALASVGIAYTLQSVAQRDAPPAHAAIILCFEGCFAALGGALILKEKLTAFTIAGFVLMLSGMLISQWEVLRKKYMFKF